MLDSPVGFGLQFAFATGRPRITVVDEHHPMTDEDVVLDGHSLADERVARDLARLANFGILLHFDKCADLCLISNFTTVEIDEFGHFHIPTKLYVWRYADI